MYNIKFQQDRWYMYNGTLSHVCVTSVALEKQWVLHMMSVCLYSCPSYLACKLHLFSICGLLAALCFSTLSQENCTVFVKKIIIEIKCALWFSVQVLLEKVHILRRIQQDMIINLHRSLCKVPIILVRF